MRITISQHEMDVTYEPRAAWRVSQRPVSGNAARGGVMVW